LVNPLITQRPCISPPGGVETPPGIDYTLPQGKIKAKKPWKRAKRKAGAKEQWLQLSTDLFLDLAIRVSRWVR